MTTFVLSVLLSSSISLAEIVNADSPEASAKIVLDRECGSDGQLIDSKKIDEDYEFAVYQVELSNGEATVYAFKKDGGQVWDDVEYSVEQHSCLPKE